MTPIWIGTIGIVTNMLGVLILFWFGTPFRFPTGGVNILALNDPIPRDVFVDKVFFVLGWLGLALVLAGNGLQIYALHSA